LTVRCSAFICASVALFLVTCSLSASPLLSMEGLPSTYVPGESITFNVTLTGATNLGSYFTELLLEAPGGVTGSDVWFEVPAAPASRYVFLADSANFAASAAKFGQRYALSISDLHDADGDGDLEGVDALAGVNDRIAAVTIRTSPSLTGQLMLSIDATSLELDTPAVDGAGNPVPVSGFSGLVASLAAAGPSRVDQVPEPSSLALLGALAGLASRRRWRRR
jgi:hypothetical protein